MYFLETHLTKEENRRKKEILDAAGYDPKTHTVTVGGHTAPFRIDRSCNVAGPAVYPGLLKKNEEEKLIKLKGKKKDNEGYRKMTGFGLYSYKTSELPKKRDPKTGKISIDRDKFQKMDNEFNRLQKKYNDREDAFKPYAKGSTDENGIIKNPNRMREIRISEKDLIRDPSILHHEVGHTVEKGKNKRYLNDPNSKESKDYANFMRDAKEMNSKKLNSLQLSSHDKLPMENFADAFAVKNSNMGNKGYKNLKNALYKYIDDNVTDKGLDHQVKMVYGDKIGNNVINNKNYQNSKKILVPLSKIGTKITTDKRTDIGKKLYNKHKDTTALEYSDILDMIEDYILESYYENYNY